MTTDSSELRVIGVEVEDTPATRAALQRLHERIVAAGVSLSDTTEELRAVHDEIALEVRARLATVLDSIEAPYAEEAIEQLRLQPARLTREQALQVFGAQAFIHRLHGMEPGQLWPDAMQSFDNMLGDMVSLDHPVRRAMQEVSDQQGGLTIHQVTVVQLILAGLWPTNGGEPLDLLQHGTQAIRNLWLRAFNEDDSVKSPLGPLMRQSRSRRRKEDPV